MNYLSGLTVILTVFGGLRVSAASELCKDIVEVMATEFIYKVPASTLPRVEVRQCQSNQSALLQLVAWPAGNESYPLIVDTEDFGVIQEAARGNVFVIETGGATRDQVFVFVFTRGKPALSLRRTTKGTAQVDVGASAVKLVIEGIYAGDRPPRTESHRFSVDGSELKQH